VYRVGLPKHIFRNMGISYTHIMMLEPYSFLDFVVFTENITFSKSVNILDLIH